MTNGFGGSGQGQLPSHYLIGPYVVDNPAISQTDIAVGLGLSVTRTDITPVRKGSVTGIVVRSSALITAGTIIFKVVVDAVATDITVQLDSVNNAFNVTRRVPRITTYTAGSRIAVTYTTNASYAPVTADFTVYLEITDDY